MQLPEDVHGLCAKDALYFSVHKFVGGAQTPGLLVAKKRLFANPVPHAGGGVSVFFVSEQDHRYVQEVRERGPRYGGTVFFVTKQDHRYVQEVRERGALAMAALSSLSPCRTTSMSKR